MSKILVVAAHPDDEILGVGGSIARSVREGNKAYALILGEGQTSRWETREQAEKNFVQELHRDTLKAAEIIGYTKVYFGNFPDNRFDSCDLLDVVKQVEKHVEELEPDIVYTHHSGDLNIDHRVTHDAVLTATRPISPYTVKVVYGFETVSSTEWNFGKKEMSFFPNVFVDISNELQIKCEAMKLYTSELRDFPHPRSIEMLEAVARRWGGVIGKDYAEAFELIREVL